jgi:glyoxylase-like metal-dependent hydrolase (beta-lactamase superfamily II)
VSCDRVIPLILGWTRVPRGAVLETGDDEPVDCPVTAVLVHAPVGWLLLDSGLPERFRDPAIAATIYAEPVALGDGGDPLLAALAAEGLAPGELAAAAISHLHADRAGGLGHLVQGPPLFVQRTELLYALGRAGPGEGYWRPAYDRPGLRWRGVRGDGPLVPGVEAIATPGHTPGHMSFLVRTPSGPPWLFAVDAIGLQDGLDGDVAIGASADPADAPLRRRSHDRLIELARAERARLVPGACARTWRELAAEP